MFGLALRGLASRKLRAALTALAIMLGVAMVAGTFMLKGSVDKAFDDIFAEANAGIDVTIQPKSAFDTGFDLPESGAALPESLVGKVEGVDGVEKASGGISDSTSIAILDENGDRIGPAGGGPPQIAQSIQPEPFNPFTWVEGAAPATDREVGIDSITADEEDYEVGQKITISGVRGAKEYTLSGIGRFGSGVPLGGASFALFTLPEAQAVTGKVGELDNIDVEASGGVTPDELSTRLNADLPKDIEAKTGAEDAAQQSADIKDGFSFLTTFLLVFAGISVFVGAFLIFNTFSITVAQRTREFGMLRTLGASSRQVLATVFSEALLLGIIASIIGIVAGLGFVALVTGAFKAMGFELPQSGIVINAAFDRRAADRRDRLDAALLDRAGVAGDPGDPARGPSRRRPGTRQAEPASRLGRPRARPARHPRDRRRPVRHLVVRLRAAAAGPRADPALRRHRDARRNAGRPRWRPSSAARSSACGGSPAASRARTPCATRAGPRRPRRR